MTSVPKTGRWTPNCLKESLTCWGSSPFHPKNWYDTQPSTVPTTIAARPPGIPPGRRTPAVQERRMIAKVASAIQAAVYIWNAAAMLMNAIEMPARVPSIAARGV